MADVDADLEQSDADDDAGGSNETEIEFQEGDTVIIREDFHSKYFQGRKGIIAGPAKKGGVKSPLWPVRIDVPPYDVMMMGKYLERAGGSTHSR